MSPQYMERPSVVFLPIVEAFDQAVASEATRGGTRSSGGARP